jgi:hypothetical protein
LYSIKDERPKNSSKQPTYKHIAQQQLQQRARTARRRQPVSIKALAPNAHPHIEQHNLKQNEAGTNNVLES